MEVKHTRLGEGLDIQGDGMCSKNDSTISGCYNLMNNGAIHPDRER